MACGNCFNGQGDQIPLDINEILYNELPNVKPDKFAYYVDGEVRF